MFLKILCWWIPGGQAQDFLSKDVNKNKGVEFRLDSGESMATVPAFQQAFTVDRFVFLSMLLFLPLELCRICLAPRFVLKNKAHREQLMEHLPPCSISWSASRNVGYWI